MYDDKEIEVLDKANLLTAAVRNELAKGTKHYRKSDGEPLETLLEILQALKDEGSIVIEPKTEVLV